MSTTQVARITSMHPYNIPRQRNSPEDSQARFRPINIFGPPLSRTTSSTSWTSTTSKPDVSSVPLTRPASDDRRDSLPSKTTDSTALDFDRLTTVQPRTTLGQGRALGITLPPLPGLEDSTKARALPDTGCKTCKNFSVMAKDLSHVLSELSMELAKDMGSAVTRYIPLHGPPKIPQPPDQAIASMDESLRLITSLKTDIQRFRSRSQPPLGVDMSQRTPMTGLLRHHAGQDSDSELPRKRRRSLSPLPAMQRTLSATLSNPSPPLHPYQRLYESRNGTADKSPAHAPQPPLPSPNTAPPAMIPITPRPTGPEEASDLHRQLNQRTAALHALQSEHAALLSKFTRERTRIAAIEKKASVAEREINSLTNTNEDLQEHIKSLESSVEEGEKKVADMRGDLGKEKKQWRGMVENQTRLMEKYMEEKKGWGNEKRGLETAMEGLKREVERLKDGGGGGGGGTSDSVPPAHEDEEVEKKPAARVQDFWTAGPEVGKLKKEVQDLKDQIGVLRWTLGKTREDNATVREHTRKIMEAMAQSDEQAERALTSTV
ncbi:hypothetical protein BDZ85DRAFT_280186 [Elsinoe ampelina]|uniref:Uncharacterized protein n=1 Tax=Elsinoe ampelina TaxID=302913 RepID=A0A6A6GHN7_9PEZI|nr:hypothetical protein BDZ85DRAFT_280186 [Elsinoe ampelina]